MCQLSSSSKPWKGAVPASEAKLKGSAEAGFGTLFAVVHDNRGGGAWTRVASTVK